MRLKFRPSVCLAVLGAFAPVVALAHPGHEGHDITWDFRSGFLHPLSGFDHLVAMVAVGLWAAQLGGRARWLVPVAFVSVMALGGALGRTGLTIPGVEQAIAASVLVLGLLIAMAVRPPVAVGMGLAGLFAIFHGFAHGAEMPATASGLGYGEGFIAATVLLHAVGLGLGLLGARLPVQTTKFAGWAVAAFGVVLFAS
jgi:urease accessory protein